MELRQAYHRGEAADFAAEAERLRGEATYHLRDGPMSDVDNWRLQNELGWHDDRGNLLRFLDDPSIEPTNNRAERALRGAVIARKVSHCSKNVGGADAFSAFTSVIRTLARNGGDHSLVNGLCGVFSGAPVPTPSMGLLNPSSHSAPLINYQLPLAFNGATAFRRWKRYRSGPPQLHNRPPSMGPPPFGDGNAIAAALPNSITGLLQWGHRLSAMETRWTISGQSRSWCLQWGHRLSAMETTTSSTGVVTPTGSTFNGATAFRRWKRDPTVLISLNSPIPSMGPPPFGDGNTGGNRAIKSGATTFNGATAFRRWKPSGVFGLAGGVALLQWGHRLSAMETVRHRAQPSDDPAPSMGPPPFGDGNLA